MKISRKNRLLIVALCCFLMQVQNLFASETRDGENQRPRFAVISDTHIGRTNSEEKLTKLLQIIVKQTPKLDALFIVGDIVDSGTETQFKTLKTILDRELKDSGIRPVVMLGNHEYLTSGAVMRANYEASFPGQYHQYIKIKDYPFITISQENYYGYGTETVTAEDPKLFLKEKLAEASSEYPGKPIFVFFHIPVSNTVYGSYPTFSGDASWGVNHLYEILKPYKQSITFSGHSHYAVADERSIYQQDFTSINDGGAAYGETEKGFQQGIHPGNSEAVVQGVFVEVKENDDVLVERYDFFNDRPIKEQTPWLIEAPHDGSKFKYTSDRTGGEAPYFEPESMLRIADIVKGGCTLIIPQAKDDDVVHHYVLEVLEDNGKVVNTLKYYSCFYVNHLVPKTITAYLTGLLTTKYYKLRLTAVDCFGNKSTPLVSERFVAKYAAPNPEHLQFIQPTDDAWVRNGNNRLENHGNDTYLEVKADNPSTEEETGYIREAFLKFDLNGLNVDSIKDVRLILTVKEADSNVSAIEWDVKYVPDINDAWDEQTITWKNKPTSSDILATQPGSPAGTLVRFDLTEIVVDELKSRNKILSLHIVGTKRADGKTFVRFHSRKAQDESVRPVLMIERKNDDNLIVLPDEVEIPKEIAGIAVSNEENEYWYYVEHAGDNDNESGGGRSFTFLTSRGDNCFTINNPIHNLAETSAINYLTARDYQLWKVEYDVDTESFILKNKVGGYLYLATTALEENGISNYYYTVAGDENKISKFSFINSSGQYVQLQRIGSSNFLGANNGSSGARFGISDQSGSGLGTLDKQGLPGSNGFRAWRFISQTELEAQYPLFSNRNAENWYYIRNQGVDTEMNYMSLTSSGEYILSGKINDKREISKQLFKLVNPLEIQVQDGYSHTYTGLYTFSIINKENEQFLSHATEKISSSEKEQLWTLRNYPAPINTSFPNRFILKQAGRNPGAKSLTIDKEGNTSLSSSGVKNAKDNDNTSFWTFELAEKAQSGSSLIIPDKQIKVYAESGRIKINGTDALPRVYNSIGVQVNPEQTLPEGIYLIKIDNQQFKLHINK